MFLGREMLLKFVTFFIFFFMKVEHFAHIICTFITSGWSQEQVLTPWSRENWCLRRNRTPVPLLSCPWPGRFTYWVIATHNFIYVTWFFCLDIGDVCHVTGFVRVKNGLPVSRLLFIYIRKKVSEEFEPYVTSKRFRIRDVIIGPVGFFVSSLVCVKVKEMTLNNVKPSVVWSELNLEAILLLPQSRFTFAQTACFITKRDFFRGWALTLPLFHGQSE